MAFVVFLIVFEKSNNIYYNFSDSIDLINFFKLRLFIDSYKDFLVQNFVNNA